MLIEALVGGAVLALTVATVLGSVTQSSSSVGRAVRAQGALEFAQAQYDRLRKRPLGHADWQVPTAAPFIKDCPDTQVKPAPPAAPDATRLTLPNARWRCRLQVTRQTDTVAAPLALSPVFRTARIRVVYDPDPALDPDLDLTVTVPEIAVELELLRCEDC